MHSSFNDETDFRLQSAETQSNNQDNTIPRSEDQTTNEDVSTSNKRHRIIFVSIKGRHTKTPMSYSESQKIHKSTNNRRRLHEVGCIKIYRLYPQGFGFTVHQPASTQLEQNKAERKTLHIITDLLVCHSLLAITYCLQYTNKISEQERSTEPKTFAPGKTTWVENIKGYLEFLLALQNLRKWVPELACDCEGNNLSRNGSVTHLNISILSLNHTWIICLQSLGRWVVRLKGGHALSLCDVLESKCYIQLWWDVRNDSDALFTHHGIRLGNVWDVQLFELMIRYGPRHRLRSLLDTVKLYGTKFWSMRKVRKWVADKRLEFLTSREVFQSISGLNDSLGTSC